MAQPPVVTAETKPRKPKGSINWMKLGVDKDPVFGQAYLVAELMKDGRWVWSHGQFKQKKETDTGVEYGFLVADNDSLNTNFTHYCLITPPV